MLMDGHAQTQVPFAGSIIEQQGIQVQTRNRAIDVDTKKQKKKSGKGLSHAMTLNNNAIDYVH